MKRKFLFFILAVCLAAWLFCGLLSLRFSLPVPFVENPNFKSDLYDFSGSIHFHTLYSDGSGTVEEILSAGRNSGLDFMIVTDHAEEPRKKIQEGFYNNILLLAGSELSTGKGHYLKMAELEFVAHPFHPFIPWKDEKPMADFDGLELLNGSVLLKRALLKIFPALWAISLYPFNSDYAFFSVYENPVRELQEWDQLTQKKRMTGISATDAHANIPIFKKEWNLKFPSYEFSFKSIKNHILSEKNILQLPFSSAKRNLYNNLKRGRVYFSLDLLLDPTGFQFEAIHRERRFWMGDQIKISRGVSYPKGEKVVFKVLLGRRIPDVPVEIKLLRNGALFAKTNSGGLEIEANQSGSYRAEVYLTIRNIFGIKRKVLWIGSNPIYVTDASVPARHL